MMCFYNLVTFDRKNFIFPPLCFSGPTRITVSEAASGAEPSAAGAACIEQAARPRRQPGPPAAGRPRRPPGILFVALYSNFT